MERLDFSEGSKYNAIEASIHLNRYLSAKKFIKGKKVLDIACGEGYGTYLLKRWDAAEVTGVDISEEALEVAREKFAGAGITFLNHTAEELPFENEAFDVVVSYETVEHLDYPEKFLAEIKRCVRKDGIIIVSCPNDPYYYTQENYSNPYHKRKYTWFDFNELAVKYLGDNVKWYLGLAVNGFATIPQDESRFPDKHDLSKLTMEEMFLARENDETWFISPDRYINYWNANYFLGIWGSGEQIRTSVTFLREFFVEPTDPIFADIEAWNKKYSKEVGELQFKLGEQKQIIENAEEKNKRLQEEYEQKNMQLQGKYDKACAELELCRNKLAAEKEKLIDLAEENRVIRIQERRTSSLLEVANKEKAHLWNRINEYNERECRLKEQNEQQMHHAERQIAEREGTIGELQVIVSEYERYKGSISYRIMRPVRKVWNILRFWKKY